MKKVLIVAYYFPPTATSGQLRILGFCRYLERYDWLPWVLTTEPESIYPPLSVDETLCKLLPRNLQIERVPDANLIQAMIRTRSKLLGYMRSLLHTSADNVSVGNHHQRIKGTGVCERLIVLKELISNWLFLFPDSQRFWRRPAVRHLSKISREEWPDVVLATGGPWTSLLVGRLLAERFGVPFVADFRDPWLHNPRQSFFPRKVSSLERLVCSSAGRVIANTQELQNRFIIDYPELRDKFVTITNGYHMESCKPGKSSFDIRVDEGSTDNARSTLEISHFGTIYHNRRPSNLFEALKELLNEKRIKRGQLVVRFIGVWEQNDDVCESLARALEQDEILQREPAIPYETCASQMASAQMLLAIQPAYPLQIPGKIYEYIASGRPILVIGGEGATSSLVERYQLGKCCPNNVAAIKELLLSLINKNLRIEIPNAEKINCFDYRNLTGELAAVLNEVCEEKAKVRLNSLK